VLKIEYSNTFKKNVKLMQKRGKDMNKLKTVTELLVNGKALPQKYRDHSLVGRYINHKECHIEPDWLLIYRIENDTIFFEEMGTHSDLF
jgi:mRNA interferase YafQ